MKKPKSVNEEPQSQQPGATAPTIPRGVVNPVKDFKKRYPNWVGCRQPAKPAPFGAGSAT